MAEIAYVESVDGVEPHHLDGFFVGWPEPPSREQHLDILRGSDHVMLARDGERCIRNRGALRP